MKELDAELIHANSPQAKGRVERSHGTLQDRLIKMMRLIWTIDKMALDIPIYNDKLNYKLVLHHRTIVGYNFRNLILASSVVKRQSTGFKCWL